MIAVGGGGRPRRWPEKAPQAWITGGGVTVEVGGCEIVLKRRERVSVK